MSITSTNLHFHGLTVPPLCHQDDVLKTSICGGGCAFRVPISDPGARTAGPLLVPPAHPRFHDGAGARRRFRRAHHRGARAGEPGPFRNSRASLRDPRPEPVESRCAALEESSRWCRKCSSTAMAMPRITARVRQAREGSLDQLRPGSVSGLSSRLDRGEAGRAAAVARGQCLRHHVSESRRARSSAPRRSSASWRSTVCPSTRMAMPATPIEWRDHIGLAAGRRARSSS